MLIGIAPAPTKQKTLWPSEIGRDRPDRRPRRGDKTAGCSSDQDRAAAFLPRPRRLVPARLRPNPIFLANSERCLA